MIQILDVNAKNRANNLIIRKNSKREIIIDKNKLTYTIISSDIRIFIDLKNNIRSYLDSELWEITIEWPKLNNINDIVQSNSWFRVWQKLEEQILEKCANINHNIPRRFISVLLNRSMRSISAKARWMNIYVRSSKYKKNI